MAVLVLPGGGYRMRAGHEGEVYAEWLASEGFDAWLLPYRVAEEGFHYPAPFTDAADAMALIRAKGYEHVHVIGSSAGGHLAGWLATHSSATVRPDSAVLCYPVTLMGEGGHVGCRDNLIGIETSDEFGDNWSLPGLVSPETAPTFIWHTAEDAVVPPIHAYRLGGALALNGVRHQVHVFDRGAHGQGLSSPHPWPALALAWLRSFR